jgi:hypothetical protein
MDRSDLSKPQPTESGTGPLPHASFDDVEVDRLRNAATAKEAWEKVKGWRSDNPLSDSETKVSWRFGSGVAGYREIEREVSQLMGERLGEVIQMALDRIYERARRSFNEALNPDGAPTRHTPSSPSNGPTKNPNNSNEEAVKP